MPVPSREAPLNLTSTQGFSKTSILSLGSVIFGHKFVSFTLPVVPKIIAKRKGGKMPIFGEKFTSEFKQGEQAVKVSQEDIWRGENQINIERKSWVINRLYENSTSADVNSNLSILSIIRTARSSLQKRGTERKAPRALQKDTPQLRYFSVKLGVVFFLISASYSSSTRVNSSTACVTCVWVLNPTRSITGDVEGLNRGRDACFAQSLCAKKGEWFHCRSLEHYKMTELPQFCKLRICASKSFSQAFLLSFIIPIACSWCFGLLSYILFHFEL